MGNGLEFELPNGEKFFISDEDQKNTSKFLQKINEESARRGLEIVLDSIGSDLDVDSIDPTTVTYNIKYWKDD